MMPASRSLFVVATCLATSTLAEAGLISWTSTEFNINSSAKIGRSSYFTAPAAFSSIESQDLDGDSGATLPVPGPTASDKVQSHAGIEVGGPNWRESSAAGSAVGTLDEIQLIAGGGAISRNTNLFGQTVKTEGQTTSQFIGEFLSTGTSLELAFDGLYSLQAFSQNQLLTSIQRGEGQVTATLLVENLTSPGTIFSQAIFDQSLTRASFGFLSVTEQAFSGSESIDLSGTLGDTIRVTLNVTGRGTAYAARHSYESGGTAGATGGGTFDEFNAVFTSEAGEPVEPVVPEPSSALLLLLGASGAMVSRHRQRCG